MQTTLYNFRGEHATPGLTYLTQNLGTVFSLAPPTSRGEKGTKTILKEFPYLQGPDSPLILRDGNLYGTSTLLSGVLVWEPQPPATPGGAWSSTTSPMAKCRAGAW